MSYSPDRYGYILLAAVLSVATLVLVLGASLPHPIIDVAFALWLAAAGVVILSVVASVSRDCPDFQDVGFFRPALPSFGRHLIGALLLTILLALSFHLAGRPGGDPLSALWTFVLLVTYDFLVSFGPPRTRRWINRLVAS